jgi:hypothetical protein
MKFEVLTSTITKVIVFWFWDVVPCRLVEVYRQHQLLITRAKMEAASTSEASVNFYQTTRCYIPEDSHLVLHKFGVN